ncbi:hypothetical protein DDB_G0293780, partial [Dictyostelium discoideum AX4]
NSTNASSIWSGSDVMMLPYWIDSIFASFDLLFSIADRYLLAMHCSSRCLNFAAFSNSICFARRVCLSLLY